MGSIYNTAVALQVLAHTYAERKTEQYTQTILTHFPQCFQIDFILNRSKVVLDRFRVATHCIFHSTTFVNDRCDFLLRISEHLSEPYMREDSVVFHIPEVRNHSLHNLIHIITHGYREFAQTKEYQNTPEFCPFPFSNKQTHTFINKDLTSYDSSRDQIRTTPVTYAATNLSPRKQTASHSSEQAKTFSSLKSCEMFQRQMVLSADALASYDRPPLSSLTYVPLLLTQRSVIRSMCP